VQLLEYLVISAPNIDFLYPRLVQLWFSSIGLEKIKTTQGEQTEQNKTNKTKQNKTKQ